MGFNEYIEHQFLGSTAGRKEDDDGSLEKIVRVIEKQPPLPSDEPLHVMLRSEKALRTKSIVELYDYLSREPIERCYGKGNGNEIDRDSSGCWSSASDCVR